LFLSIPIEVDSDD